MCNEFYHRIQSYAFATMEVTSPKLTLMPGKFSQDYPFQHWAEGQTLTFFQEKMGGFLHGPLAPNSTSTSSRLNLGNINQHMGVSINGDTPKWMVFMGKPH